MNEKEKVLVESALSELYRLRKVPLLDVHRTYFNIKNAIADLEQALYGENK